MINSNKYSGCFLGLAMGDTYGAPFEGGPVERLLWQVISKTKDGKLRYTDDTQMSIDVANSFIENNGINQNHLAATFAENYRWSRGYGPSAAWLLRKIRNGAHFKDVNRAKFKEGSYGNGAAMRAPILAMCFPEDREKLDENIVKCSEITHAHPLAIEGAKLIAYVANAALHDWDIEAIRDALPTWCSAAVYQYKVKICMEYIQGSNAIHPKILKRRLGNGVAASQSCVTAIYFSLKYRNQSNDAMLDQIHRLGGDVDTIGAMAGAIWGAFNGCDALDRNKAKRIEHFEEIMTLSEQLHEISFKGEA